jgi:hypothetical protein
MKAIGRMAGLGILVVAFSTSAFALTLVTPTVDAFLGETFDCIVTNFSPTKSLSVTTADIIGFHGTSRKTSDNCSGATLFPMTSCEFRNDGKSGTAYCIATAKGNFRLQLNDLNPSGAVVVVAPGTK